MTAGDQDSHARIDELIRRFFDAFDNREGRLAEIDATAALFTRNAVITRHQDGRCELYSPSEFLGPRIELLTSGALTAFHEWELSAETNVFGPIAVRVSRYRKSGFLHNAPYAGDGTKVFQLANIGSTWKILALSWIDDA